MAPAPLPAEPQPELEPGPKISRRKLLKVLVRSGIGVCTASIVGLAYAHEYEPSHLRVSPQTIAIPNLGMGLDGLRIAHLSDIHMDEWMTHARVASVARRANSLNADLIVLTGDFISRDLRSRDKHGHLLGDARERMAPGLIAALQLLSAPLGVWGVLGNHDHWTSGAVMSRIIREGGVREMDNRIAPIERNGSRLWLCGVDDTWAGHPDLPGVIQQLQQQAAPDEPAILMAHEPDYADEVAESTGRIALQLSGHSHGGQVNIPFIGPPILPPRGRKYHTGLHDVPGPHGPMQVFTTRGIGVVNPRLRFNCPPEISLLTLRRA